MASKAHLLSFASLNVRGARDFKKRNSLFFWLKEKQFDIVFLQESYWTDTLLSKIKKEWDGKILLNAGTEHSKGSAILFRKDLKFEINSVHMSDDSRILLTNVAIENKLITLVNIYAPNTAVERKSFFNKLQKWLSKFSENNQHVIMGGDFNYTDINEEDRTSKSKYLKDSSSTAYKALTNKFNFHDVWREMNPNRKVFTYKDISRLDKFLVSTELVDYIQKSNIVHPGVRSDHKCITLGINLSDSLRGPGRWKLNTSVLKDKTYCKGIKNLFKNLKQEYNSLSKQLIWELCKIKIKEYTISYCTYKQKIKKSLLGEIEVKINQKEQELEASHFNKKIQVERDIWVNEFHHIVREQSFGAQVRSRAKWVEEGERSTKYFFNLEKQNASLNTIKQLKTADGSYTTSETEILDEEYNYRDHPVSYFSKKFNKHQKNYSTIEKECLSLILALQHF